MLVHFVSSFIQQFLSVESYGHCKVNVHRILIRFVYGPTDITDHRECLFPLLQKLGLLNLYTGDVVRPWDLSEGGGQEEFVSLGTKKSPETHFAPFKQNSLDHHKYLLSL